MSLGGGASRLAETHFLNLHKIFAQADQSDLEDKDSDASKELVELRKKIIAISKK